MLRHLRRYGDSASRIRRHSDFVEVNAIIGIKSYYCVILQMVILHDAIKQFRIGSCVFFSKERTLTSFF